MKVSLPWPIRIGEKQQATVIFEDGATLSVPVVVREMSGTTVWIDGPLAETLGRMPVHADARPQEVPIGLVPSPKRGKSKLPRDYRPRRRAQRR
jgi:hypothetical protein